MSNDKKITVELTVEQAMAVIVELPYKHKGEPELAAVTQAMESALAIHREEQERASLGTPWEAEQNSAGGWHLSVGRWMQFLSGPKHLTEAQAKLMSAAPELADALGLWVAWSAERHYSELEDCIGAANAALRKSGMLK